MNVIECKQLVKMQRNQKTLDHVNFSIKENTITGLIGRNGAGKTTLLKIIAGYWRKTAGDINVFGVNPFNSLFVSANTIFVDDQMSFSNSLSLLDLLEEAGRFYPNWDMSLAKRLFDYFGFLPNQIHENLSKGKKSTFNMIIGLAAHCPLTIFDEPTTGMDVSVRKDFYRALLKDYLEHPRTIIISSHHLEEVEDLLEDILLIKDGRVHLHLTVDGFKEYAVGLRGNSALIYQLVNEEDVLYTNRVGGEYVIVKNTFSHQQAKRLGLEISPVTPNDLCVYLTNTTKGGIDDVFKTS
ncbi:ATP-binding cassette domain-containing protein [Ornithinibacillus halophilus]|uniref:ABC-2 type transport system ATP-binding protein n=1 Tax=Ornithinibacillus halophilus TaxID=930117 RepID=A0A1M5KY17_9BACI|nr:ABC transporter ATP-binding protein [Ornithinibacillus halophilus]SHG57714.1 ABC-2 type transport system ATP-binding protein [Ornithinibacillus halophilus]